MQLVHFLVLENVQFFHSKNIAASDQFVMALVSKFGIIFVQNE